MREIKKKLNKLYIHPKFKKTIEEINKLNIKISQNPSNEELDFRNYTFPTNGELVSNIEEIKNYKLDPKKGQEFINKNIISAYDESVNKFLSLEGSAYMTSHSLIVHYGEEYLPSTFLSFNFYTRSKNFTTKSDYIQYSLNHEVDSKIDYVRDRTKFILDHVPNNSILFIDGPLIGGQISEYTLKLNDALLKKNVIPIFFVKNTTSNLVTDNIRELKGKFNSDMHWAFRILKKGERTNFFRYTDKYKVKNSKLFCYIKPYNISPQRIEFHLNTFEKYHFLLPNIMNLIYYLILVQGNLANPHIRSIIIVEDYARDTLQLMNLSEIMKSTGIIPTINQERFAWG